MSNIEILDNFLDAKIFKQIQNTFLSESFPWFYSQGINSFDDVTKDFMFNHMFLYRDEVVSNYFYNLIIPIIGNLKFNFVYRVKANAYSKKENHIYHDFHLDDCDSRFNNSKHYIALYSINTNNGFTELEGNRKIESIENRLVLFDGNIKHRSVTQTDTNLRINVNLNLAI